VAGAAAAFSFSLGGAGVALPLLALAVGYSGAAVGVLTAVSGASQMVTRAGLGIALSRIPDRVLVVLAALLLAASNVIVAVSAALVPFVIAELLQGGARGCFWTGSQSHVVRRPGSAVRGLAYVNFISSFGLLAGPVVVGVIAEANIRLSLVVAGAVAVVASWIASTMTLYPPYHPPARKRSDMIWRRPGVAAACWAGVSAGGWRGLLSSFVPVVLTRAGQSAGLVGVLVAVANGAAVFGAGAVGRLPARTTSTVLGLGTLATGLGTAATAVASGSPMLAGLALALSGLGAGALQVLGPALAAEAVHPEERGLAVATTGTFRAASLLLAPLAVSGLVLAMPVTAGLAVAGLLASTPAALTFTRHRLVAS